MDGGVGMAGNQKDPGLSIQEEEAALSFWPRRLLHVPTMTSYPWEVGNVYGGFHQPFYNAISYTWGRFEVRKTDPRYASTTALPVRNVPWEIPKIDPDVFTTADFQYVLQRITKVRAFDWCPPDVEFVWLDVACIDQRRDTTNSARSDSEIGRQVEIFSRAQSVVVWLHTVGGQALLQVCELLEKCHMDLMQDQGVSAIRQRPEKLEAAATKVLQKLLTDPWFSSLWTLQEAFLSTTACLLSREGNVIYNHWQLNLDQWDSQADSRARAKYSLQAPRPEEREAAILSADPVALGDLLSWARLFLQERETEFLIRSAGLLELGSRNPMAAYTAASSRRTSRTEDRVYAIQQIFRMRLGKTAAGNLSSSIVPRRGREYEISELHDQLGEQLLLQLPVLSQMHLYTTPTPPGKAWRVLETCVSPGIQELSPIHGVATGFPLPPNIWSHGTGFYEAARSLCKLNVRTLHDNVWGTLEGKMCAFHSFWDKSKQLQNRSQRDFRETETLFEIWRDVTDELQSSPTYSRRIYHSIPTDHQAEFAEWLTNTFAPTDLKVFVLGFEFRDGLGEPRDVLGLLLHRRERSPVPYWRRIGVYRHRSVHRLSRREVDDKTMAWLEGKSEDWQTVSGLFG